LGIAIFNHTHYDYLQVLQPSLGESATESLIPLRRNGEELQVPVLEDILYDESAIPSNTQTQIALITQQRIFQNFIELPQFYNETLIVILITLLAISFIIKLMCVRNKSAEVPNKAATLKPKALIENEAVEEISEVKNSAKSTTKEEALVENNKQIMLYKQARKASIEMMELSLRSDSDLKTSQVTETNEYKLEKQPGIGIVKIIKQEIKKYYPDKEESNLLEEAKNLSKAMGVNIDSKKVSLRDTKITFGVNIQKDANDAEIKSVYTIATDIESERSLENGKFTKSFDCIELLGVGGFAEVYKARHVLDEKYYAIKRIVVQHNTKKSVKKRKAYREIYALQIFDHPNIVRYITCWTETLTIEQLNICKVSSPEKVPSHKTEEIIISNAPATSELGFEWDRDENKQSSVVNDSAIPNSTNDNGFHDEVFPVEIKNNKLVKAIEGKQLSLLNNTVDLAYYIQMVLYPTTLREYLKKRKSHIDSKANLKYFTQVISALTEIHSKKLIHRDMKPANIFLDSNDNVKVGDFGLTVKVGEEDSMNDMENSTSSVHTEGAGTKQYLSPEQENRYYDQKVDIYATGLILMELCCIFDTEHERLLGFERVKGKRRLPEGFDCSKYKEEGELVLKMTESSPDSRPTAKEVFKLDAYKCWIEREKE